MEGFYDANHSLKFDTDARYELKYAASKTYSLSYYRNDTNTEHSPLENRNGLFFHDITFKFPSFCPNRTISLGS